MSAEDLLENGDSNLNLHPPLVEWEMSYPTAEGGGIDHQITCADLEVVRAARARPGARARADRHHGECMDLGFLSSTTRHPLQLLARFEPMTAAYVRLPARFTGSPTRCRPWCMSPTYARRSWVLSPVPWWCSEQVPLPAPGEGDADSARLQSLAGAPGMPREVYLRVMPPAPRTASPPGGRARGAGGWAGSARRGSIRAVLRGEPPPGARVAPTSSSRSSSTSGARSLVKLFARAPGTLADFLCC